jgi:Raf kinase inhibitor-like YbhB/YbcL family protein
VMAVARRGVAVLVACGALLAGCGGGEPAGRAVESPSASPTVTVSSPAVTEGGTIPRQFTCDGDDTSLPLAISRLPAGTAEVALLVEDPDAPDHTFTHWLVWGIDPGRASWPAGQVPPGAMQGRNDFGKQGYGGPCPPEGQTHRYVVTAFAVSRQLSLESGAKADDLRREANRSLLGWGRLTARYRRG